MSNSINRRRFLKSAAALSLVPAAGMLPRDAFAAYPDRPITMIVPWGAGGGTDAIARVVASEMEKDLGKPINVVNRTGGGGVVGHSAIATAAPDGYTIGMATLEITLYKAMGLADISPQNFTPLARMGFIPGGVSVAANSPYKTIQELIAAIKAAPPGTFKASGVGVGGSWHINMGGVLRAAGIDPNRVRWVPSQGGAPAFNELVAGSIDIVTASPTEGRGLIDAGKVRPLAITHGERIPLFPNAPTIKEVYGVDWQMSSWMSLLGPKGLPADISAKLIASAKKAQETPAFATLMKERGFIKVWEAGPDLERFLQNFQSQMEPVLRGLQLIKS